MKTSELTVDIEYVSFCLCVEIPSNLDWINVHKLVNAVNSNFYSANYIHKVTYKTKGNREKCTQIKIIIVFNFNNQPLSRIAEAVALF